MARRSAAYTELVCYIAGGKYLVSTGSHRSIIDLYRRAYELVPARKASRNLIARPDPRRELDHGSAHAPCSEESALWCVGVLTETPL
jgi:hypothetical protein